MRFLFLFLSSLLLSAQPVAERLGRDIAYLAGPDTRGRGQGTPGLEKAADYIAARYRELGIPVEVQRFPSPGLLRRIEAEAQFSDGPSLVFDREIHLLRPVSVALKRAPLVYVGCGIRTASRDDYARREVKHGVAVMLQNPTPAQLQGVSVEDTNLVLRILDAERAGAIAVLLLEQPGVPPVTCNDPAITLLKTPVFEMKLEVFKAHVKGLQGELQDCDPQAWGTLDARVLFRPSECSCPNLIARIPGRDPMLAPEYVALGAHFDHLGEEAGFASLALGADRARVHPGADDNASGTAMVLDLARRLKEHPLRRSVLLLHFSGEELGLLGSAYWSKHTTVPVESVKFFFCFDMVGRLDASTHKLWVGGVGTTHEDLARIDAHLPSSLHVQHELGMLIAASDHASLAKVRIPSVFFTTGLHNDYHRPTDTAERVDVVGEALIEDAAMAAIHDFGDAAAAPSFDESTAWFLMPRTSIRLDFGALASDQMDPRGLLLGGCKAGSPAAHAGLRAGDVLLSVAKAPIHSLQDLEKIVRDHKVGDSVLIAWIRDGRRCEARAVLSSSMGR